MGNLVPEQRTDKNGRLVTRHVRSNSTVPTTSTLPKPSLAGVVELSKSQQQTMTKRMMKEMEIDQARYMNGSKIAETTLSYLAYHSPADFIALDDEIQNGSTWLKRCWGASLDAISYVPVHPIRAKHDKDFVDLFRRSRVVVGVTATLTEEDGEEPNGTVLRSAALRGLIRKIPIDDESTVRAALVATWILPRTENGTYSSSNFEPDNESLSFIMDNYDQVMEYRHVLKLRGSIAPEVMNDIIKSNTPSLSSGVL